MFDREWSIIWINVAPAPHNGMSISTDALNRCKNARKALKGPTVILNGVTTLSVGGLHREKTWNNIILTPMRSKICFLHDE